MALNRCYISALMAILAMVLPAATHLALAEEYSPEFSPGLHTGWMEQTCSNVTYNRTYDYCIPSSYDGSEAVPLLFSFHGLGSNGAEQRDLTKFDVLAEQEGFIAVFPDATELPIDPENPCCENVVAIQMPGNNIQWNIGLNWSLQYCAGVDDVGFVSDMVDWFEGSYNIDTSRIYATGMSNGAMFSHYLALMLPGTFAGIGPVCAPLTTNVAWESVSPVTVIMMMGTDDPIVPYGGYSMRSIHSMNDTVDFWLEVDGVPLETEPVETVWGPTASDLTVVHRYIYSGGTDGTEVILFQVEGGGHTWPGGIQWLPWAYIGYVTTHVDGSALIWKHLPPPKHYLGIHSSESCSATADGRSALFFDPGDTPTEVSLVATPGSGYRFVDWTWTGDISAIDSDTSPTTTVTITPNQDYEIYANFIAQYDLTIDSTDGGEVTTPGEGLFPDYDSGTVVDLVATPANGYEFVDWSGGGIDIGDANAQTTTITMNGDYSITASFQEEPEEPSGGTCFIATAAYGTPMAEEIQLLREFRDKCLLTNPLGQGLIDLYYSVSPPVAEFITENPGLKSVVRVGIVPAVAMSTIALNTSSPHKAAIIGLLTLVSGVLAVWATGRRGRSPLHRSP